MSNMAESSMADLHAKIRQGSFKKSVCFKCKMLFKFFWTEFILLLSLV